MIKFFLDSNIFTLSPLGYLTHVSRGEQQLNYTFSRTYTYYELVNKLGMKEAV